MLFYLPSMGEGAGMNFTGNFPMEPVFYLTNILGKLFYLYTDILYIYWILPLHSCVEVGSSRNRLLVSEEVGHMWERTLPSIISQKCCDVFCFCLWWVKVLEDRYQLQASKCCLIRTLEWPNRNLDPDRIIGIRRGEELLDSDSACGSRLVRPVFRIETDRCHIRISSGTRKRDFVYTKFDPPAVNAGEDGRGAENSGGTGAKTDDRGGLDSPKETVSSKFLNSDRS